MTLSVGRENVVNTERSSASLSGLLVAVIGVGLFALAAFSPAVLNDGDTWSHVATGDWILAHGAVPRVDPFSHSMPGAPWTAHEWLSEVLFALAYRALGWSGVVLVTAFPVAAAALVLGLRVARDLSGVALLVVVLVGVSLWAPSLLARPHVLALPLVAVWTAGLLAARDQDAPPPLLLALVMTIWANLHGGFIFGLAMIAPFACEAVVASPPGLHLAVTRSWALFALAAVGAALVTPYGIESLLFPFRLMAVRNLAQIQEWSPQDFSRFGPMEAGLIALLGFALTRRMSAPPIRVALVLFLIALALAQARHALLLGLIAPMLLAPPIAKALGAPAPGDLRSAARVALTAGPACVLVLSALRVADPIVRVDGRNAPIAALAAVPPDPREKPVLNAYDFGGYLIFAHVRPFIDGRADTYRDTILALYQHLAEGDPATFDPALARYRIAWTIFPPGNPIVAALDRRSGWRRLYADGFAVVHVPNDALRQPPEN